MNRSVETKEWMRRRGLLWILIFGVFTVIALFNYIGFVTLELAEGNPPRHQFYLIMETTGAYTVFLLLPLLLWFLKRFPIRGDNWHVRIPMHLMGSVVYGATHTTLMFLSRRAIFRFADLGTYDYGDLRYRYLMEYSHQFVTYWLFYGVVMFIKYFNERREEKIRAARLEEQLTRVRLQALQMQLNPHFLFNTLNMISSTIYDRPKAADKMIANLSDLLRRTLKNGEGAEHPLRDELELIRFYVEIMKARFEDDLAVSIDVSDAALSGRVPKFILQPIIENAITHSMETLSSTKVEIGASRNDNRMTLNVRDNGPGFSNALDVSEKGGVGLANTIERLEQLYARDHRFEIRNLKQGGCEVVIDIPFRTNESHEP